MKWILMLVLWLSSGNILAQVGQQRVDARDTDSLAAQLDAQREKRGLQVLLKLTEKVLVSTADAMPADKYGFAPTDGEFKGVRTFGQMVKHLSATNYILAAAALGEEPPADAGDELGFVGRLLGWDREPPATERESFATRLTSADRSRSLALAGTRDGLFRVVYRFENEQLLEVINRTAHAAALSALVETPSAYRFYFGVYVRNVSRFTPVYMTLIDPFRKLVVYPSLLRTVRTSWNQTFGGLSG